jgi:hypothetical protein
MDLERFLDKCRQGQWKIEDLDWSVKPKSLPREDEIAIVQYFTDMAGIERLAKALFEEQRRRTEDPTLKKIFSTFVVDEERHARVAERLAAHYDVHQYKRYRQSESLTRFAPHFVDAIRYLSAEVANAYITSGELLLDVALLRSLDDYVDDDMSKQAMQLINRDESRHIAIDYYMVEYYCSPAYQDWLSRQPRPSLGHYRKAAWAMGNMILHAAPFLKDVFLAPMQVADPQGRRLREAFKRIQLLSEKPEVADRPFPKFVRTLQFLYRTPGLRQVFGGVIGRLAGVPGEYLDQLYTDEERRRARAMSYDQLAEEALAAKYVN